MRCGDAKTAFKSTTRSSSVAKEPENLASGTLVLGWDDKVQQLDLATGRKRRTWDLPRRAGHAGSVVYRLQLIDDKLVALLGDDYDRSGYVVVIDGEGRRRVMAAPAPEMDIIAIEGGILVVRRDANVLGYALEPTP